MIEHFYSILNRKFEELKASEKKIIDEVWKNKSEFVRWPTKAILLWEGEVRRKYHKYPDEIKRKLKSRKIPIDSRSNGPAISCYLFAGGERPKLAGNDKGWPIHHVYNGKFPFTESRKTLYAVKNGKHFTQSACLVAIHPIAHTLSDEYYYFAWLLRLESFIRFNYDPDLVFCKKNR